MTGLQASATANQLRIILDRKLVALMKLSFVGAHLSHIELNFLLVVPLTKQCAQDLLKKVRENQALDLIDGCLNHSLELGEQAWLQLADEISSNLEIISMTHFYWKVLLGALLYLHVRKGATADPKVEGFLELCAKLIGQINTPEVADCLGKLSITFALDL